MYYASTPYSEVLTGLHVKCTGERVVDSKHEGADDRRLMNHIKSNREGDEEKRAGQGPRGVSELRSSESKMTRSGENRPPRSLVRLPWCADAALEAHCLTITQVELIIVKTNLSDQHSGPLAF